jgi:hypothetical protein
MISLQEPASVQIHHRETRTFGGVQIKGQFQLRRWDNCYPDRLFLSASNVALRLPNKRNGTPRKGRAKKEWIASSLRSSLRWQSPLVIPGCASWRRPGIHTHDRGYGFSDVQLHIVARAARAPE